MIIHTYHLAEYFINNGWQQYVKDTEFFSFILVFQEADIGLGPFGMSYSRGKVVDFTIPVFLEMLHVLVNRPLPQPDSAGFLAPFTWVF